MIGLGATTAKPRGFTAIALVAGPIATVLTGILEFLILNGADDFPLLAVGLAPFVIGAALLISSNNLLWSSLGRAILPFTMLLLAPSNPQTYNPQAFLFTSVFIIAAAALLLATQTLIPPLPEQADRISLCLSGMSKLPRDPSTTHLQAVPLSKRWFSRPNRSRNRNDSRAIEDSPKEL